MANFLIKITEEPNVTKKKDTINKYYCKEDNFQELHLACGTIYYYGINNLVEIDYTIALKKFLLSFNNSRSKSYRRFCFSYIYKAHKKIKRYSIK